MLARCSSHSYQLLVYSLYYVSLYRPRPRIVGLKCCVGVWCSSVGQSCISAQSYLVGRDDHSYVLKLLTAPVLTSMRSCCGRRSVSDAIVSLSIPCSTAETMQSPISPRIPLHLLYSSRLWVLSVFSSGSSFFTDHFCTGGLTHRSHQRRSSFIPAERRTWALRSCGVHTLPPGISHHRSPRPRR